MLEILSDPNALLALLTLTVMEIVLGVDNIIFISILAGKLPEDQQAKARRVGLLLALGVRILLLLSISWIMKLKEPLFDLMGHHFSGKDLVLLFGGLFLIYKATKEIHEKVMDEEHEIAGGAGGTGVSYGSVLVQIMLLDIVFSLDSVITAVGMAEHVEVMVIAVVIAVIFMMIFVNKLSDFVNENPTVKMLALSFLFMIGMTLVAEGWELHIPKGYIYCAMAFSVLVEMLNLRASKVKKAKKAGA